MSSNVPYEYDTWETGYRDLLWLYVIGLGSFVSVLSCIFPARTARRGGAVEDTLRYEMVSLCDFLRRCLPDCSNIPVLVQ